MFSVIIKLGDYDGIARGLYPKSDEPIVIVLPFSSFPHYFFSVLWLIEIALSSVCVVWLCENYVAARSCEGLSTAHKNVILGE